jgi:hypothetical protein
MSTLVTGIFTSRAAAENAVNDLIDFGYSRDDISVLMTDTTRGREFAVSDSTKAPEGAATGAAVGGVLGAIAAGLVAVGTITIPGLALAAAGPVVASLAGLGAGAAAGGLLGALSGLGIPEHEARFYHDEIKKGGILVGVYAHKDRVKATKEILDSAGAEKVRS